MMSLKLEFASLKEVAYYTTLLENSVLVKQVSIKDISHAKKVLVQSPTIQTSTLVYYSVSLDIQLKSLGGGK
jgi:hypothetical protein